MLADVAQYQWVRILLIATSLYTVSCVCHNIARMSGGSPLYVGLSGIVLLFLWVLLFGALGCFGMARNLPSFVAWGFVIDRKLWISAVLVVVAGLILVPQLPGHMWSYDDSLALRISAATLEEIVFRGILISTLMTLVRPKNQWVVAGLICVSALLFAIIHIPMHTWLGVQSAFTSAIFLGYIFYWTRSVLFPIFIHVAVNSADASGLLGGAIAVAGYFIVAALANIVSRSRRTCEVSTT